MPTVWAPNGEGFTTATLIKMRFLAQQAISDPLVVWTARRIAVQSGDGSQRALVAHYIRDFLAAHIVYVPDPVEQETLSPPRAAIQMIQRDGKVGMDCDEIATLGAALAKSVGLPATFRVLKFAGDTMYGHVFTVIPLVGGEVSLDIQTAPPGIAVVKVANFPV